MNIETKQSISFNEEETRLLKSLFIHIGGMTKHTLKKTFGTNKDHGGSLCPHDEEKLEAIIDVCKTAGDKLR